MTFFSPPAPKGFRYPWYGILFSGVCSGVGMSFVYAFVMEMWGKSPYMEISEFLVVGVLVQGITRTAMRASDFDPETVPHSRTIREWIRLWMVSSLAVCALGLICRLLTGRLDPLTLALYQFTIPTAVCIAAYAQNMADRHALCVAKRVIFPKTLSILTRQDEGVDQTSAPCLTETMPVTEGTYTVAPSEEFQIVSTSSKR